MSSGFSEVLIVDSHPLIRACLSHIIDKERDLKFSGEADGKSQALEKIKLHSPALVIVDISLADGCGIDLIEHIKAHDPQIKILVASMNNESLYAERALLAGAQGYVGKDVSPETFLQAIRQVLKGKIYLSNNQRDLILNGLVSPNAGSDLPGEQHPSMQALSTGKSIHGVIAGVYNSVKKKYVWLSINAFPMFKAKADKPYEVFVTLHDITDRKEMEDELELQSSDDPLINN